MLIEWLSPSFLYGLAKDVLRRLRSPRKKLTAQERMALREKWQALFAEEIHRCIAERLRKDVIVHDVDRDAHYPGVDSGKGRRASSWFRAALVAQYHKGIELALGIHSLVWEEEEQSWRLVGLNEEAPEAIKAYLIGYVPYESIVSVNWDGDEYYYFPHIFCHFEYGGEPYERLAWCQETVPPHGRPFYSAVADYASVKLTSEKFGTDWASRYQD